MASCGRVATIEVAHKKGGDIEATNAYGATPLHYAAGHNQPEMVSWLVKQDADIEASDVYGSTPAASAFWNAIRFLAVSSGIVISE